MFSFFKRSKSKDSNNSSSSNNTEKNDKQKSNNSFFNKKNEVKRRNSDNDSKGGPSTSPTLPVKSGNSDINGIHTASVSTTNCTDKTNTKTVENIGVKMGNVEDKPQSSVTDNNENKNNGEGKTEEPLKQGETNFNTPTTSVFNSGSVHHKMRAEFLNSVLTNKNMDIKNDFKNSGCGFSGVSEGVTSPSGITTTVEESDSVISQTQPVIKKEGTPDSDIIFKTAPNTPVLSRVPNITITELPSINEDINKQLNQEEITSTPNIEPIPKGNCDNISSKTNTNQTESNQNLVIQETQNNSNPETKLENKTNELINHIIPKICIEMAEIEESSSDVNLNKDYITFGESENEEEDISQEISKSDASNSTPFQDKSSSISEKSDENITNDPKSNILNENNIVNNENLNDKFSDNSEILNNSELNETIVLESNNENETECNRTNQSDQTREYSKETEDEASDSEMEDTEDKNNEETENNDEEFVEVEVEEEEEIIEPENQVKKIITDNQNTQEIVNENQVTEKKNEDNSLHPEKSTSSLDQQNSNIPTDCEIKENLVNIESKADRQIRDLTTELKQGEKEINNLKIQVGDLQREVIVKGSGMDRLQAELTAAYKESECVRKKLKRLEEDLDSFKQKNSDLTDEINRKTESENENDYWKVIELENEVKEQAKRIKDLEQQISVIRQERDKLAQTVAELAEEREEERKIVQEALDEAMAEKVSIQEKYEREFERLRTVNTEREQKALDDFEWKLREVQAACKKRLDEKEQSSQQLIREIEGKLLIAEGKLAQLPHLKQCEQELLQVRERSIEQTRALRTATRQAEQLQNTEKLLQDEVQHLKALLEKEKSHLTTVQSIHYREISEKDRKLQFKLEQQKNELNTQWEDKLRRETQRAKTELEKQLRSEKQLALEELRQQHESKLRQLKSSWEKKHEECTKEIEHLKQKSSEKEEQYKSELETVQTNSDRDIFELRRKLDKIDVSYQEKMEKMQEKHDKEIERITEEADRKIQQCELNWQQQVGSSRTTIELVKEQMQRESQEQLQSLSEHHRAQLEEQWDQLIQERDETIALMEQKHRASMEKLRNELDSIYKSRNSRETELLDTLTHLRQELSGKTTKIDSLKSNVDELHENLEVLSTEINEKNDELTNAKQTTDEKIRQREQQLEELHQGQIMELNERHQKELVLWQNNVGELQKKVAELAKKTNENHSTDMSRKIDELQRALKEKDLQVANLSKEKHLYQLELMNKETVQARQRKKGGRGGNNSGGGGSGSGGVSNSNRSNRGGRGDHSSRQSQRGTASANHR